jgi:hypothetical protein
MTYKLRTLEQIISELGEIPYCQCGCGHKVKIIPQRYPHYKQYGYPKYIIGHTFKGKKRPEHLEIMSGSSNPMYGNPREDLQIKFKGEGNPMYGLKGELSPNFGSKRTEETKEKLKYLKSQEHKDKISKTRIEKELSKGEKNPMFGIHLQHTEESKLKIGMGVSKRWEDPEYKKLHSGENSSSWKGGSSFFPYCPKFDENKKEEIRNKYNRCCIICNKPEQENIINSGKNKGKVKKLHVHHVDYNKNQGCEGHIWKLTPLCMSCHGKTTSGSRQFWETKICEILKLKGD